MKTILFISISFFIFSVSCSKKDRSVLSTTEGVINIYVDKSISDIILQEEEVFERHYPKAQIQLFFLGEKDIFPLFLKDSIQVIIGCRSLNTDEKTYLHQNQQTHPREFPFANSAIAFISSINSPDSILTYEEIISIFDGSSKTAKNFNTLLIEDKESGIGAELIKRAQGKPAGPDVFASSSKQDIFTRLTNNTKILAAIEWSSWSDSDRSDLIDTFNQLKIIRVSKPIDSTQIGFLSPYQYYLNEGGYPFTRELSLITRTGQTDLSVGFASFIAGEIGQKIILKAGLFPKFQSDRWIEIIDSDFKVIK